MDAGFDVIICRPYRPETNGKIESLAKLVDRLMPFNEEFNTFNALKRIIE